MEALCGALAAGQPFQLLIADSHMPEMDGFTLVEKIQQTPDPARTLVIMMLRYGDLWRDAARCRKLGIAVHLTKPIRRAELRKAILTALNPGVAAPPGPKGTAARVPEDRDAAA